MPIDPRRMALTPEERTAERLADLERYQGRVNAGSLNRLAAAAVIENSAAIDVPGSAVVTPLTFDTAEFDTDGMWSSSAPDRLTINTPGFYLFVLEWGCVSAPASAFWAVELSYTTVGPDGSLARDSRTSDATHGGAGQAVGSRVMAAGDFVTAQALHTTVNTIPISQATTTAKGPRLLAIALRST